MTPEEARTIFKDMKSINPLVLDLHKRFELGQPESGSKNLIKNDERRSVGKNVRPGGQGSGRTS